MLHTNQNLKGVRAVAPVDLRKRFSGLYATAHHIPGEIPEAVTHQLGEHLSAEIHPRDRWIYDY